MFFNVILLKGDTSIWDHMCFKEMNFWISRLRTILEITYLTNTFLFLLKKDDRSCNSLSHSLFSLCLLCICGSPLTVSHYDPEIILLINIFHICEFTSKHFSFNCLYIQGVPQNITVEIRIEDRLLSLTKDRQNVELKNLRDIWAFK